MCVTSIWETEGVGKGLVEAYSEMESSGAVERKKPLGSFRINGEHVLNRVGPGPALRPECWLAPQVDGQLNS